jgi:hypothetical protein
LRSLLEPDIHVWRDSQGDRLYGTEPEDYGHVGAFLIRRKGIWIRVLASDGGFWDHVSVSIKNRCPTWEEMEFVKRLFFEPPETAMQLHVPSDDHVNYHPNCLHLWRPQRAEIPRPPSAMVGPKSIKEDA